MNKNITGLMIYYYFICQRKLWYFINEIGMEQNSELVKMGKIIDETTYIKEKKKILIDNTINIDFIKNKTVLHEIKKSKAVEEAGVWQTKYYMYYLEQKGVKNVSAEIDYPFLRETKLIELNSYDKDVLDTVIDNIKKMKYEERPCEKINSKICKKCSYFDLCYV